MRDLPPTGLADRNPLYTLIMADGSSSGQRFYVSEVITPQLSDVPWGNAFTATDPAGNQFDDTIGTGLYPPSQPVVIQQYFVMSTTPGLRPPQYVRLPVNIGGKLFYSQTITIYPDRSVTIQGNPNSGQPQP